MTEVTHDQRPGRQGEVIHEVVIRELRRSLATGELDRDMSATYGLRRVGIGR